MARRRKQDIEPSLDQNRIVYAALELLDKVGLKQLTMRKLAEYIGIQAGALYWHVKDKEELLGLLADRISSEISWPEEEMSWKSSITIWAHHFRKVLHSYRDSVEIFNNTTISTGIHQLKQIEKLFAVLSDTGFKDKEIPWIASMIKSYILGIVSEEAWFQKISNERQLTMEELGENVNEMYQSLSEKEFPHMQRLAGYLTSPDWEQEFSFGLETLLEGFARRLDGKA